MLLTSLAVDLLGSPVEIHLASGERESVRLERGGQSGVMLTERGAGEQGSNALHGLGLRSPLPPMLLLLLLSDHYFSVKPRRCGVEGSLLQRRVRLDTIVASGQCFQNKITLDYNKLDS